MRIRGRLAAAGAAVTLATIAFAGQASAAGSGSTTAAARVAPAQVLYLDCARTGVSGGATVSGWNTGPDDKLTIQMNVYDTEADGHSTAVRFKTQGYNGVWHYYTWHRNSGGNGTSLFVNTTVQDTTNGIFGIGIEAATMNGTTVVQSCEDHLYAG